MRPKAIFAILLAALLFSASGQGSRSEPADEAKKPAAKPSRAAAAAAQTREILELLQHPIDMKDFQQPMKLKEALGLFYEKFDNLGKELPILIDIQAFMDDDPNADDIRETDVQFPPFPRKLSLVTALRLALSQIQAKGGATFLIRPGRLEITTLKRASLESLLKQRILIDFRKRPLAEVLEELADRTATTVILDERVGKKAETPITAVFRNEADLGDALILIANMAELKVVYLDSAVFITTPDNACRLRQEMQERERFDKKRADAASKPAAE